MSALVLPGGAIATTAFAATATDAATTDAPAAATEATTVATATAVVARTLRPDIPPGDYQQVQLAYGPAETGEAMSLAVLRDRAVPHTARDGTVRHTDAVGNTKVAGGAYGKTGEAAETAYLDRAKHWVDRFDAARAAAGKAGGP